MIRKDSLSFEQIRHAFDRLAELSGTQRDEAIKSLRAENPHLAETVLTLLAAADSLSICINRITITESGGYSADAMASGLSSLPPDDDTTAYFGSYRVTGLLGYGGMGIVYEALQTNPHRTVAIKKLNTTFSPGDTRSKLIDEAQKIAMAQHPSVVHVYEVGILEHDDGTQQPYLVMEHIDGLSLHEHITQNNLTTAQLVALLASTAEIVHQIHDCGIIHRDLKPENIIVDRKGLVRLLDFGIASLLSHSGVDSASNEAVHDQVEGTLQYMSPEQLALQSDSLEPATRRSDVYSLGAVAYEVLSGRPPHDIDGLSVREALASRSTTLARELSQDAPSLPIDLVFVIMKALAQEPQHRYATAADFAADLRRFLSGAPVHARPFIGCYRAKHLLRRHTTMAAVMGIVLALLVLVGWRVAEHTTNVKKFESDGWKTAAEVGGQFALTYMIDSPSRANLSLHDELVMAEGLIEKKVADWTGKNPEMTPFVDGLRYNFCTVVGQKYYQYYSPDRAEVFIRMAFDAQEIPREGPGRQWLYDIYGDILIGTKKYEEALQLATEAIASTEHGRFAELIHQGNEAALQREISLRKNYADALFYCDRFDEASSIVSGVVNDLQALEVEPTHSLLIEAIELRGRAYEKLNRHDEAIAAFERALELRHLADGPSSPLTWRDLYLLLLAKGDSERAEEAHKTMQLLRMGQRIIVWNNLYEAIDPARINGDLLLAHVKDR
ncbi:MAG: serine/threonine protein kinase [Planctomycetes bacterium]|nr:serine/threonine protein kinase [Planctomycetota bacterium]NOG56055.1 protein kinase [Planctomycetota bacterium]